MAEENLDKKKKKRSRKSEEQGRKGFAGAGHGESTEKRPAPVKNSRRGSRKS